MDDLVERDLFDWLRALPSYQPGTWLQEQTDAKADTIAALRKQLAEALAELNLAKDTVDMNCFQQAEAARLAAEGENERIEFQRTTTEQLGQMLSQQQALAQQLAAVLATLQAQQRELDKRR